MSSVANKRHPDVVIGPLPPQQVPGVHINPFGVIPKDDTPGKWRLIVDLSSPTGGSVNDGIPPEWCSLSYMKVDDVARQVAQLGRGAGKQLAGSLNFLSQLCITGSAMSNVRSAETGRQRTPLIYAGG